jgi:hypothetical protein
MEYVAEASAGLVKKNLEGKDEYSRLMLLIIRDDAGEFGEKGKAIAVAEGTFLADEKKNTFYFTYIGVPQPYRRKHIATLLEAAMFTVADDYARDAEKRLGVSYPTDKNGHKVMSVVGECEYLNLEDMDSATRMFFHRERKFYMLNPKYVRYLQPDLTLEEGMKFDRKKWNPVPLGAMVSDVGGEKPSEEIAIGAMKLMYDGFITSGMNKEDVLECLKYALANLDLTKPLPPDLLVLLPGPTEADLLRFLKEIGGDAVSIYKQDYPGITLAKKFIASVKEQKSIEEAVRRLMEAYNGGTKQPPGGM